MNQETKMKKPKTRGIVQLVLIIAAVMVAIYFARGPGRLAKEDSGLIVGKSHAQTVNIITPEVVSAARKIRLTGVISVSGIFGLRSKVSGEVVSVSPVFRSGGAFSAGETLVLLDRVDYEIALRAANARLRHAEARLLEQELKGESGRKDFESSFPGAEVPPLVLRTPHILQAQAAVDRAREGVKKAELDLSRTIVSLPFDGRVKTTAVEVGELAGPGRPIGSVFADSAIQVRLQASHEELAALEPVIGRSAAVSAAGETFEAVVERVGADADLESRMVTLYLAFKKNAGPKGFMRPGTFANIVFEGPQIDNVFVLPEVAEQARGIIWVVENSTLKSITPNSFGRNDTGWLVEAFDPGDGVVIGRVVDARPGLAVMAVKRVND